MKRIALAATMALALAGTAKADWIDYWGFAAGGTQSPDLDFNGTDREMQWGFNLGGVVGWNQSEEISVAADVLFTQSEYENSSSSLQTISAMLNAIYVCDTGDFWRPFLGAGAGGVEVNFDRGTPNPTGGGTFLPGSVGSGSEWAFGYQAMAGIAFEVDETHAITIGYRYQASEDVTITGRNVEYASHSISIGVLFD